VAEPTTRAAMDLLRASHQSQADMYVQDDYIYYDLSRHFLLGPTVSILQELIFFFH
jgi:hypothetical protein